ncbi:MAG: hypothetical protein H6773_03830 [Pseudomonadales bacterium]|nr:hypothetical protein [Candidatus Woesebacteria bacterium]MCB9801287.1 hypothetical protein [Pseudomonadales bacterium]
MGNEFKIILRQGDDITEVKAILHELKEAKPVLYSLLRDLVTSGHEPSYTPDRAAQIKVLAKLPADLITQMKDFLVRDQEYQEKYFRGSDDEPKRTDHKVAGELFEILVRIQVSAEEKQSIDIPNTSERVSLSDLTNQFLEVWQYPQKFGIRAAWRNPDAAFLDIDAEGHIYLKAVGEVKAGLLDMRAFEQLRVTGIEMQVKEVLKYLRSRPANWFDQNGLDALKVAKDSLDIHPDGLKIRLFVPAHKEVSKEGITRKQAEDLIKKRRGHEDRGDDALVQVPRHLQLKLNPVRVRVFMNLLQDSSRISVQQAVFSGRELYTLANTIISQMK